MNVCDDNDGVMMIIAIENGLGRNTKREWNVVEERKHEHEEETRKLDIRERTRTSRVSEQGNKANVNTQRRQLFECVRIFNDRQTVE